MFRYPSSYFWFCSVTFYLSIISHWISMVKTRSGIRNLLLPITEIILHIWVGSLAFDEFVQVRLFLIRTNIDSKLLILSYIYILLVLQATKCQISLLCQSLEHRGLRRHFNLLHCILRSLVYHRIILCFLKVSYFLLVLFYTCRWVAFNWKASTWLEADTNPTTKIKKKLNQILVYTKPIKTQQSICEKFDR